MGTLVFSRTCLAVPPPLPAPPCLQDKACCGVHVFYVSELDSPFFSFRPQRKVTQPASRFVGISGTHRVRVCDSNQAPPLAFKTSPCPLIPGSFKQFDVKRFIFHAKQPPRAHAHTHARTPPPPGSSINSSTRQSLPFLGVHSRPAPSPSPWRHLNHNDGIRCSVRSQVRVREKGGGRGERERGEEVGSPRPRNAFLPEIERTPATFGGALPP